MNPDQTQLFQIPNLNIIPNYDTQVLADIPSNPDTRRQKSYQDQFSKLSQDLLYYSPLKQTVVNPSLKDYLASIQCRYSLMGASLLNSTGGAAEIAKFPFMGQWFALKTVLSEIELSRKNHFQSRYAIEQILNEAMVLDEIGYNKNIINVHYYGWFPNDMSPFSNRNFILLDFCGGGDLSASYLRAALFTKEKRYRSILKIAYEMAQALNTLARLGVVHRDIKPQNILWDSQKDKFVLIDFGLAIKFGKKLYGEDPAKAIIGTPAYMSPEQIKGESVDFRSDQYALGAVLYELISGKPPHEECHSSYEILTGVLYNKINISAELCKIEELRRTIHLMTQKDKQRRIQDSQELVDIFKDLLKKYP